MVVSDTGRERAIRLVSDAYARGLFGADTLNRRLDAAFAAKSVAELDRVVSDVPRERGFRDRVEAAWQRYVGARLAHHAGPGFVATVRVHSPRLAAGESAIVGRGRDAHLHIDSDTVSRSHARLTRRGGALYIEDLGSLNGTWINGWRIDSSQRLCPGDEVIVGTVRLVFEPAERSEPDS
ncbi:MAG: FHA domain-containing protein [Thermoleophilaceae bacterium]